MIALPERFVVAAGPDDRRDALAFLTRAVTAAEVKGLVRRSARS